MEHSWKWNIPTYLNIFIRIKIFIIRVSFFKYMWKIPFPRDNQSNHIIIIWYEWKLIHICNLRWLHKTQCFITLMNEHEEEKKALDNIHTSWKSKYSISSLFSSCTSSQCHQIYSIIQQVRTWWDLTKFFLFCRVCIKLSLEFSPLGCSWGQQCDV